MGATNKSDSGKPQSRGKSGRYEVTDPKPRPGVSTLPPDAPESPHTTAEDLIKLAQSTEELATDVIALANTVADRLFGYAPSTVSETVSHDHGGMLGAHEAILYRIRDNQRATQQVLEFIMEALK